MTVATRTRKGNLNHRIEQEHDDGTGTAQLRDGGVQLNSSNSKHETTAVNDTGVHTRRTGRRSSVVAAAAAVPVDNSINTNTMANMTTRKGKGRVQQQPQQSNGNSTHAIIQAADSTTSPSSTPSLPDILPAPATSFDGTSTRSACSSSSSSAAAARRRSSRHGGVALEEEDKKPEQIPPPITLYDIPDTVLQPQGISSIPTSLIDNLPERAFPKKGITLHPLDAQDALLTLCGKVLASVDNRALTPKEIALILARRHGWPFSGPQPFAIVSSCIRTHVRRANTANPPYAPIFVPYEMSSVPPAEDIPCLGIEIDAKPVVKRGTFWHLSEQMGYGRAFPHRKVAATFTATSAITPSTSTNPTELDVTSTQPQPLPLSSSISSKVHRRSSSRHQSQLAPAPPTQPIPIMPAPPVTTTSTSSTSLPQLAPSRSKSDIKTDRLTRAQKNAQSSSSTTPTPPVALQNITQQELVQSPSPGRESSQLLSTSAPPATGMQVDPLGRGKRKRTTSKAAAPAGQPLQPLTASADYPHLQQLPTGAAASATAGAQGASTTNTVQPAKGPHRRAFSSSASDKVAQRPIPALRKLKFRLSAVSETAVLESDTSASAGDVSMTSFPATMTKKITLSNPKKASSSSSTKQPKNKRARTQSMSHRTNTTASFPFDDLHLHHSMQQQLQAGQSGLPPSLHNAPSFHTSSSQSGEGTLFPFEMHIPSSPANALDLLTSRSAPEGNIFSPALAAAHHNIAGPFSRSHSPSSSMLSHHHHHSGRRSLPPNYGNEDETNEVDEESALEYDGWGMESDHLDLRASGSSSNDGKHPAGAENSFHEAMLKNDDIDFAFDFSLGSLGESASRRPYGDDELQGGNLSLEDSREEENHMVDESSLALGDEEESRRSRSSTVRDGDLSKEPSFGKHEMDSMLDGLDDEDSHETVKEANPKRASSVPRRSSSTSEDVDMSADADESVQEKDAQKDNTAKEKDDEDIEEDEGEDASHAALLDRKAFEKALNTTLCPAAAKFGAGTDASKTGRLLIKRTNSTSSLTFTRTVPKSANSDAVHRSPTATPLLRPALVSRTNSRDVLSTAVPLAELPSIPLETSRRDSFLFYHLTSDADHPPDYSGHSAYLHAAGKENDNSTTDDMSDAASSSSASTSSSLLTRIVKSEEELDDMVDMEEHAQGSPDTHRGVSRCCSTASAISRAEVESNDSFNPEMIYAIGRRAPNAELGNIGGQGEIDEMQLQHTSRSQSSSRTTSLSPRDSFSPNMVGPHGCSSSDLDADWALTPPSEEEHVDEDEKNLDRATMLGLESVGMDDLDDVWPGVRRSLGGVAPASHGNIEAQVDGVTCDFKIMEVFEPVLPAAPIPQVDLPAPVFSLSAPVPNKSGGESAEDSSMQIDQTPMDEHAAAAMFIADESLHPPKPAPIVTVTAAVDGETETPTPQPSLSPVSAAAKDASTSADAQEPTSIAVNASQQKSANIADKETSTTPVQPPSQAPEPPASTQSFLFNPDVPFHPEISILLTDTKILFYSTIVNVSNDGRPLLRRVDNDAVDAEALLLSLEGASDMDSDRLETLRKIKEMGNTWVSLDFARELLKKYGGPEPLLGIFLADDILLSWPEKLVKLGTMLRQKNGLPPPASSKHKVVKNAFAKAEKSVHRVPTPKLAEKPIQPKKASKSPSKEEVRDMTKESTPVPIQAKKEAETATTISSPPSSPGKKDKTATKASSSARRASSRIKPTGT